MTDPRRFIPKMDEILQYPAVQDAHQRLAPHSVRAIIDAVLADARALGRDGRSHGGNGKRRYCKTDERFVQCHGRLLSDWCGHEVNVAKN